MPLLDCLNEDFLNKADFFLKLLAGSTALYLFLIGFKRHGKDQTWKRREFIAKEIKDFTSDPVVKNAMYMLDWGTRYIELFPNKPIYKDRFVKVDREGLCLALQIHESRACIPGKVRFNEGEVAIRDIFDHFFGYFERFNQFIEAKMIFPYEIKPYLKYWIESLGNDIELDTREVIYEYIDYYKFEGVVILFDHFKVDLRPKSKIQKVEKRPNVDLQ